jgi:hypothetical protein
MPRLVLHPMRLRTLGQFAAIDPWCGNRPTEFSVEEYVMMPAGSPQALDSALYAHRIGIRSELDGSERLIPESLYELWKRGQVPGARVPVLAHAMAPRVLKEDLNLILDKSAVKSFLIVVIAVFVLISAILGFSMSGTSLTFPIAIGIGAAVAGVIGLVYFVAIQSGRNRRKEQMKWLLSVNAGDVNAAPPAGRGAGRAKLFLKLYAIVMVPIMLAGGVGFWALSRGWTPASPHALPAAESKPRDLQKTVFLTEAEAAAGKTVSVTGGNDEQLTVKVPAGVRNGTRLRVAGKGWGSWASRSDLYLIILVH